MRRLIVFTLSISTHIAVSQILSSIISNIFIVPLVSIASPSAFGSSRAFPFRPQSLLVNVAVWCGLWVVECMFVVSASEPRSMSQPIALLDERVLPELYPTSSIHHGTKYTSGWTIYPFAGALSWLSSEWSSCILPSGQVSVLLLLPVVVAEASEANVDALKQSSGWAENSRFSLSYFKPEAALAIWQANHNIRSLRWEVIEARSWYFSSSSIFSLLNRYWYWPGTDKLRYNLIEFRNITLYKLCVN